MAPNTTIPTAADITDAIARAVASGWTVTEVTQVECCGRASTEPGTYPKGHFVCPRCNEQVSWQMSGLDVQTAPGFGFFYSSTERGTRSFVKLANR